jgi:DNA-damage-inducible protein D
MTEIDLFHHDSARKNFESLAQENGFRYWLGSSLAECLGYADSTAVKKAINKAMTVCMTLNIPVNENFQQHVSEADKNDFKLSRFACYLTVMNGDVRNPLIAKAQAYYAGIAVAFREHLQQSAGVERVLMRGEISEREASLSHTAKKQGVENYAFFQNAGYRGMYNMNLGRLKNFKGLGADDGSLLDYMGKEELAANLFRITQTDAKIRNEGTKGQFLLEKTAEGVGRDVRNTMIKISGQKPEELRLERNIADVKKGLKQTHKGLKQIDSKPKKKAR